MTTSKLTFRVIQLEGHPPLDPYRISLFSLWFDATTNDPALACDERWRRIGAAIVSGAPLTDWVCGTEMDPWDLPENTPGLFLDELEELVEDEEGTDLQHLSWGDHGFSE
ncbi:MAG: hypothetical protein IIB62_01075 [Proteobacteria bacterium]|nr:hypothetical protein [Pseudomonadota bacterium]